MKISVLTFVMVIVLATSIFAADVSLSVAIPDAKIPTMIAALRHYHGQVYDATQIDPECVVTEETTCDVVGLRDRTAPELLQIETLNYKRRLRGIYDQYLEYLRRQKETDTLTFE